MKKQMANPFGSRPNRCPQCGEDLKYFDGDRCPRCNSLLESEESEFPSVARIEKWLEESAQFVDDRNDLRQCPTGSWRTSPDSNEHGRIIVEFFSDASALVTWASGKAMRLDVKPTEMPNQYRLVRAQDESSDMMSDEYLGMMFEVKAEGVAMFTHGNREHFRMEPGGIHD